MGHITRYRHHGQHVAVQEHLKGRHREHCLCYRCVHFRPDTLSNCYIAKATLEHCRKYAITTPVWECALFRERKETQ